MSASDFFKKLITLTEGKAPDLQKAGAKAVKNIKNKENGAATASGPKSSDKDAKKAEELSKKFTAKESATSQMLRKYADIIAEAESTDEKCPQCKGSGTDDAYYPASSDCRACGGTGKAKKEVKEDSVSRDRERDEEWVSKKTGKSKEDIVSAERKAKRDKEETDWVKSKAGKPENVKEGKSAKTVTESTSAMTPEAKNEIAKITRAIEKRGFDGPHYHDDYPTQAEWFMDDQSMSICVDVVDADTARVYFVNDAGKLMKKFDCEIYYAAEEIAGHLHSMFSESVKKGKGIKEGKADDLADKRKEDEDNDWWGDKSKGDKKPAAKKVAGKAYGGEKQEDDEKENYYAKKEAKKKGRPSKKDESIFKALDAHRSQVNEAWLKAEYQKFKRSK